MFGWYLFMGLKQFVQIEWGRPLLYAQIVELQTWESVIHPNFISLNQEHDIRSS